MTALPDRVRLLLTLWQRLGAWLEHRGPKEAWAAQMFFTANVVVGTVLCFGFRPVMAGFRDWLRWRLSRARHGGHYEHDAQREGRTSWR